MENLSNESNMKERMLANIKALNTFLFLVVNHTITTSTDALQRVGRLFMLTSIRPLAATRIVLRYDQYVLSVLL